MARGKIYTNRKKIVSLGDEKKKQSSKNKKDKKSAQQKQEKKPIATGVFDYRTGVVHSIRPEDTDVQLMEAEVTSYLKQKGAIDDPKEYLTTAVHLGAPNLQTPPTSPSQPSFVAPSKPEIVVEHKMENSVIPVTFWREVKDPKSSNSYYWNPETNQTSWTLPENAVITSEASERSEKIADPDNEEGENPEGLVNAYNHYAKTLYGVESGETKGNGITQQQITEEDMQANASGKKTKKQKTNENVPVASGILSPDLSTSNSSQKNPKRPAAKNSAGSPVAANTPVKKAESPVLKKLQVSNLSDEIFRKLEYLHVSREKITELQRLHIQLETRMEDWKDEELSSKFFLTKLKNATDQVNAFVQDEVPSGWTCVWDRASCRYYFNNTVSGDISWEFPVVSADSMVCDDMDEEDEEPDDNGEQPPQQQQQQEDEEEEEVNMESVDKPTVLADGFHGYSENTAEPPANIKMDTPPCVTPPAPVALPPAPPVEAPVDTEQSMTAGLYDAVPPPAPPPPNQSVDSSSKNEEQQQVLSPENPVVPADIQPPTQPEFTAVQDPVPEEAPKPTFVPIPSTVPVDVSHDGASVNSVDDTASQQQTTEFGKDSEQPLVDKPVVEKKEVAECEMEVVNDKEEEAEPVDSSNKSRGSYAKDDSDNDHYSSSRRSRRQQRSRSRSRDHGSRDLPSSRKSSKKKKKEKKSRHRHRDSSSGDEYYSRKSKSRHRDNSSGDERYSRKKYRRRDSSSDSDQYYSRKSKSSRPKDRGDYDFSGSSRSSRDYPPKDPPPPVDKKTFVPAKFKPKGKNREDADENGLSATQLEMMQNIASVTASGGYMMNTAYPIVTDPQQYAGYYGSSGYNTSTVPQPVPTVAVPQQQPVVVSNEQTIATAQPTVQQSEPQYPTLDGQPTPVVADDQTINPQPTEEPTVPASSTQEPAPTTAQASNDLPSPIPVVSADSTTTPTEHRQSVDTAQAPTLSANSTSTTNVDQSLDTAPVACIVQESSTTTTGTTAASQPVVPSMDETTTAVEGGTNGDQPAITECEMELDDAGNSSDKNSPKEAATTPTRDDTPPIVQTASISATTTTSVAVATAPDTSGITTANTSTTSDAYTISASSTTYSNPPSTYASYDPSQQAAYAAAYSQQYYAGNPYQYYTDPAQYAAAMNYYAAYQAAYTGTYSAYYQQQAMQQNSAPNPPGDGGGAPQK